MTRRQFLLVASIVPGIFGSVMMLAPQLMLENSLTQPADEATSIVTRWVGFAVFAVAWITFFARRDDGSPALRAVLTGNVVFHVLGFVMDVYGYAIGIMSASGLVSGVVPHALLTAGCLFYLSRMPANAPVAA